MKTKFPRSENVVLENVRLSFNALYQEEAYKGVPSGKYGVTVLIDKSDKQKVDLLFNTLKPVLRGKKFEQYPSDKMALRDGDLKCYTDDEGNKRYPEYENKWSLRAYVRKKFRNDIKIVGKLKQPITEENNIFYSGCYVNIYFNFWSWGDGVSANLVALQFVADGEPTGGGFVNIDNVFDEISDDVI